jgi:hypothetical protein
MNFHLVSFAMDVDWLALTILDGGSDPQMF